MKITKIQPREPYHCERRIVKKFAWFPKKFLIGRTADGNNDEHLWVWLETYYAYQEFWGAGLRWITQFNATTPDKEYWSNTYVY
jgi:hypothetical protein